MFKVNEFYKTSDNDIVRCIRGYDGQYDFTFRYDDGEFKAIYTNENGVTQYGFSVFPEIINITKYIRELNKDSGLYYVMEKVTEDSYSQHSVGLDSLDYAEQFKKICWLKNEETRENLEIFCKNSR